MAGWQDICDIDDVPLEGKKSFSTSSGDIIIVNIGGEFYAVDDVCSHDGGNLSDGWLRDGELVCPRHGARFCPKTGEALTPPAYEPINTYPVRLLHNKIQVKI